MPVRGKRSAIAPHLATDACRYLSLTCRSLLLLLLGIAATSSQSHHIRRLVHVAETCAVALQALQDTVSAARVRLANSSTVYTFVAASGPCAHKQLSNTHRLSYYRDIAGLAASGCSWWCR
jgi:hypothetical protein